MSGTGTPSIETHKTTLKAIQGEILKALSTQTTPMGILNCLYQLHLTYRHLADAKVGVTSHHTRALATITEAIPAAGGPDIPEADRAAGAPGPTRPALTTYRYTTTINYPAERAIEATLPAQAKDWQTLAVTYIAALSLHLMANEDFRLAINTDLRSRVQQLSQVDLSDVHDKKSLDVFVNRLVNTAIPGCADWLRKNTIEKLNDLKDWVFSPFQETIRTDFGRDVVLSSAPLSLGAHFNLPAHIPVDSAEKRFILDVLAENGIHTVSAQMLSLPHIRNAKVHTLTRPGEEAYTFHTCGAVEGPYAETQFTALQRRFGERYQYVTMICTPPGGLFTADKEIAAVETLENLKAKHPTQIIQKPIKSGSFQLSRWHFRESCSDRVQRTFAERGELAHLNLATTTVGCMSGKDRTGVFGETVVVKILGEGFRSAGAYHFARLASSSGATPGCKGLKVDDRESGIEEANKGVKYMPKVCDALPLPTPPKPLDHPVAHTAVLSVLAELKNKEAPAPAPA